MAVAAVAFLLAIANFVDTASARCGSTVLSNNFNQYSGPYRAYTESDALRDFPVGQEADRRPSSNAKMMLPGLILANDSFTAFEAIHGKDHVPLKGGKEVGDRAYVGEGSLRVLHPKGGVGTWETGMQFAVRLPQPLTAATLSYKVKFEDDYHWTRGGKLPGLCDEDCPTGCIVKSKEGGWCGRVHWREQALSTYMYLPNSDARCGETWNWNENAVAGEWFTISLYIQMNSAPGRNDGVQRVWMDDELVFEKTDVIYDYTGTHGIDRFKFDNFHGGSSNSFSPEKDQYVFFDDILVQDGECPPGSTSSSGPTNPFPTTPKPVVPTTVVSPAAATAPAQAPGILTPCVDGKKTCMSSMLPEGQRCCTADYHCVLRDAQFAQCRLIVDTIPSGWLGTIVEFPASTKATITGSGESLEAVGDASAAPAPLAPEDALPPTPETPPTVLDSALPPAGISPGPESPTNTTTTQQRTGTGVTTDDASPPATASATEATRDAGSAPELSGIFSERSGGPLAATILAGVAAGAFLAL